MDAIAKIFKEQIDSAISNKTRLRITGSGSKDWYGNTLQGIPLCTREYAGVISYQPDELVITVRSGTSLKEVEDLLKEKNQQFPFEPPHFGEHATIGGMIASGLAGPGRISAGGLRDFVLGCKIMDGTGSVMNFGGTVMKNVAGYDVSRLMPGSLGTLALLLDVSIKVLPITAAEQTLKLKIDQHETIELINLLASQPWPINASAWLGDHVNELYIRLRGARAAVEVATEHLSQTYGMSTIDTNQANHFWHDLKEQNLPWFERSNQNQQLWRIALPTTTKPLSFSNSTLLEWHGGQRWLKGPQDIAELKQVALAHGGHASLFRGPQKSAHTLNSLADNPLTKPLQTVEDRLRKTFDPHGIFSTERLI